MPNWCEGTLKVRGKFNDLRNFILNGLRPVNFIGDDVAPLRPTDDSDTYFCVEDIPSHLHMKGTRRHFCQAEYISFWTDDEPTKPIVLLLSMKAAWAMDSDSLLNLCKEFHVDMKVQGFERGMEFSQIIEIVNGEILQDDKIEYDDWSWDCPCPHLSG